MKTASRLILSALALGTLVGNASIASAEARAFRRTTTLSSRFVKTPPMTKKGYYDPSIYKEPDWNRLPGRYPDVVKQIWMGTRTY